MFFCRPGRKSNQMNSANQKIARSSADGALARFKGGGFSAVCFFVQL